MNAARNFLFLLVLMTCCVPNAFGGDTDLREPGIRHHGPPPEAYAACEGKNVGDSAQFVSPRGDTVTGTCEQEGDRLVLRPEHSKPRSGGRHHGPPLEAYTACEGKSEGDEAQFVDPCGRIVSGTCEWERKRLVLRPDHTAKNAETGENDSLN